MKKEKRDHESFLILKDHEKYVQKLIDEDDLLPEFTSTPEPTATPETSCASANFPTTIRSTAP